MKNILAENLLRFVPKNLSESDIKRLQMLMEAATAVDMNNINSTLKTLNTTLISITNRSKEKDLENAAVKYFSTAGQYYLKLYDPNATSFTGLFDLKTRNSMDRSNPDGTSPGGWDWGYIETPNVGLGLFKTDPGNFIKTNTTMEWVYGALPNSSKIVDTLSGNLEDHKKNLQEAVKYGVNSKDQEVALSQISQINQLLDTLINDMQTLVDKWPAGKVVLLANAGAGYEMNLYNNGDPEVSITSGGEIK